VRQLQELAIRCTTYKSRHAVNSAPQAWLIVECRDGLDESISGARLPYVHRLRRFRERG